MKPAPAELALFRTRPQQIDTKLVIYKPPTIFACRVNDTAIQKTALSITYDTVSSGAYMDVKAGMTMYVGTAAGKADVGRVRVKNATSTILTVAENGLDWADNLYLTVVNFYELWPKSSLDVKDGINITHYIDYDIPYGGQNQYMGSFLCIGPPGVCEAGESIYWGSTGTIQTDGMPLNYTWTFGGGIVTGSEDPNPGYIQYNAPGYYMTEVGAFITGTSYGDITYRPVIVLGGSVQPYINWGFDSLDGSRDEGSWTAKLWLREENMPEVMDGSLCVIYQDSYYGATRQNIGGNSPNRQKILFIGYIIDNSITYDWKSSKMEFAVSSPTGRMKLLEGLSVSMDNVGTAPVAWQQVKNLNGKKALYYYLKWHTTVLNCCDVRWMISPDPEIPSWDSEISSVYDITQKFADTYYLGEVVSDRQGTIWVERHPKSVHAVTGTYVTVMDIDRQDWVGEIDITEQLSSPISYLEMHGLSYAGIATGTINDYLSAAPFINKRNPFGMADFIQGYVVNDQTENNQIVGDTFAHKNASFPLVDVPLAGWYSLFDIAPEECVTLTTIRQDTARGVVWNRKHFMLREMTIERDAKNKTLLPAISLYEVTQGTAGAAVPIPTPVAPEVYPEFPPITGGWTDLPWPFDWPKPWVEPPEPVDDCRGNQNATWNGPYGLGFDKSTFATGDTSIALFPCYVRQYNATNPTRVYLYGVIYNAAASWNSFTLQAIDSGQNVVATAICTEDHGFPNTQSYGVYQFSSLNGFEVAGFKLTTPGTSGNYTFILGSFISSGQVLGTDSAGVAVGPMVAGNWYAIEVAGGPYYYYGTSQPDKWSYRGQMLGSRSGDFGGDSGYGYHEEGPNGDLVMVENRVNGKYGRGYFQAVAASVNFRCIDSRYDDNTGSLDFYLYNAIAIDTVLTLAGAYIENVCL